MTRTHILILPGLYNSGAGHWQSLWENLLPNASRLQQRDWERPDRGDWVATLDAAIRSSEHELVIAAHSLGCATTAWWAQQHGHEAHARKLKGALLVAPPDVERKDFPVFVTRFAPMPRTRLPFRSTVVASLDDPWCTVDRAESWATAWGAAFHAIGPRGHINAESGLGDWPQGRTWLGQLAEDTAEQK